MCCTGAVGIAPGAIRRGVLVLLQTLAPYIVEHLPAPHTLGHLQPQPQTAQVDTGDAADGDSVVTAYVTGGHQGL